MLERKIELKRNPFLVFSLRFLPIIFWGGFLVIWSYDAFNIGVSKSISFFFLIVAICFGVNDLKNNNKVIKFSESGVSILKYKKKELVVEKFYPVSEFININCNERFKNVYLTVDTGKSLKRYELLKYNSAHMLGADKYFMVKAELCRYFPAVAHECIDNEVKDYIENGHLSEFVKSKVEMGRCQAIVLFIAELVFSLIPLSLSLLSFAWVIAKLIYHGLLFLVFILDKFKI